MASPPGAAQRITPNSNFEHANYAITEAASGLLTVGFFNENALYVTSSSNGRQWSAPQVIARGLDEPSALALGAAGDGGGFAAFQEPEHGGVTGSQIDVAAFGSFAATHLKGLGNLNGDGLGGLGGDPLASVSCTDVHFGDIDAIAEAGCFLRDPSNPTSGAAIISSEIRLNGLEIIPDAGVQIVIDPRQHTINTTGEVRIVLRAPGIGDITLYHQALHVSLSGSLDTDGHTLFNFDTATASTLKGFPFDTSIDVQIQHDAVVIPVSLKLPAYMGGVTGAGHPPGRQRQRAQALLAAHRRAGPGSRRARGQGPQHRLRRHRQRLERLGHAEHPRGHAVLRDRRRRPLRRRRLHHGLVQRQRALPRGADLHRQLSRRLRRWL